MIMSVTSDMLLPGDLVFERVEMQTTRLWLIVSVDRSAFNARTISKCVEVSMIGTEKHPFLFKHQTWNNCHYEIIRSHKNHVW